MQGLAPRVGTSASDKGIARGSGGAWKGGAGIGSSRKKPRHGEGPSDKSGIPSEVDGEEGSAKRAALSSRGSLPTRPQLKKIPHAKMLCCHAPRERAKGANGKRAWILQAKQGQRA